MDVSADFDSLTSLCTYLQLAPAHCYHEAFPLVHCEHLILVVQTWRGRKEEEEEEEEEEEVGVEVEVEMVLHTHLV